MQTGKRSGGPLEALTGEIAERKSHEYHLSLHR